MPTLWILLTSLALAQEPSPTAPSEETSAPPVAVEAAASPITIPLSPDDPGPFKCKVDPFFTLNAGETAELRIRLSVPKDKKLYQDMVSVEVLESRGLNIGELNLPKGEPYSTSWGEERVVYSGDVELLLPISTPAKAERGRHDLQIQVFWQGCSEGMCYRPGDQSFNVPVRVKSRR